MSLQIIAENPAQLGEGPVWWEGSLYWVDILAGELFAYRPNDKSITRWSLGKQLGSAVPSKTANIWVLALEDGLYRFNLMDKSLQRLPHPEADQMAGRFNDGKCDSAGRFWVGTIAEENGQGRGHLYRLDPDGSVSVQLDGIGCSNGLAWSADGNRLYYIDSTPNRLYQFDFDPADGSISNQQILLQYPDGPDQPRLDGMAIDQEGRLWIALWGGGAVICVDPASGEEVERISLPALNVTSCAFGGENLEDLYITTASIGLTDEQALQFPEAGLVFRCQPGTRGFPSCRFNG